jgi:CRP-like cAMP-binding protein
MKAVFKTTSGKDPGNEAGPVFREGDLIFRDGELGTEMFIIQEGEVDIVKRFGDNEQLLTRLGKGDFFGEMAVLESLPRSADAIARGEVRLIAINGSQFDEMMRRNPEIAVRIMRKYAKRLREADRLLEQLAGGRTDLAAEARKEAPTPEPPAREARPIRHRLVEMATGTAFYVSESPETTIGRSDPVTGIHPDVDLTGVDTNRSVSRRHAKIVRTDDGYALLEEVGTVNGTFVNEQRIPTGIPVPVQNGDSIKIGLVQLRFIVD